MAITKKEGRQEEICAIVEFDANDFTAMFGADAAVTEEAINLPVGAIITGGFLVIDQAFDTEGKKATGTLTTTDVPHAADTVTVAGNTYEYVAALSAGPTVPNEVLIGTEEVSLDNLAAAINGTGTEGVEYSVGTVHRDSWVVATTPTAHTMLLTAVQGGTSANSLGTTSSHTHGSFGAATLTGGESGGDTIAVKISGVDYLAATSVTSVGATALTPTGTKMTAPDTLDLVHDVANTSIATAEYGTGRLIVRYIVDGRACFTQD
jgi:hypothetical protein